MKQPEVKLHTIELGEHGAVSIDGHPMITQGFEARIEKRVPVATVRIPLVNLMFREAVVRYAVLAFRDRRPTDPQGATGPVLLRLDAEAPTLQEALRSLADQVEREWGHLPLGGATPEQ